MAQARMSRIAGSRSELGAVDQGDAGLRPQRIGQRTRQRQADGTGAGDNDIVAGLRLRHGSALAGCVDRQ